jgi:predicted nucleotidyltransferase component of viral defense system
MNEMFTYIKSDLERISRETGFIQNSLEKVLRIMDILDQISKHPFLKKCFALKGGTALNIFYFNLPRLSIDADLNYIREVESEGMSNDRQEIDGLLPELFSEEYIVTLSKKEYALSQFEMRYDTVSMGRDLIKIEINYLHRLPMMDLNEIEIQKFGSSVKFSLLGLEELIASKSITLLSRYTPRDLYDLSQLALLNIEIEKNLIRNLVLYYGIVSRESIFNLFEIQLDNITEYSIRTQLYPMLTKNDRPDLADMKSTVSEFITPFTQLNDTEIKTINNFFESGLLDVNKIFTDKGISQKVLKSPNYKWKSKNIKQMLQRSH